MARLHLLVSTIHICWSSLFSLWDISKQAGSFTTYPKCPISANFVDAGDARVVLGYTDGVWKVQGATVKDELGQDRGRRVIPDNVVH